jgi:hypothetical protein
MHQSIRIAEHANKENDNRFLHCDGKGNRQATTGNEGGKANKQGTTVQNYKWKLSFIVMVNGINHKVQL